MPSRVLRVERRVHELAHLVGRRRRAQAPVERALDEAVAVLDRRRLGHDRQDRHVRQQEEVEDVVRGAGPEVDEHHVHVERPDLVHHPHLLQVLDVRGGEQVGGPADQRAGPGAGVSVRTSSIDRDAALDEVARACAPACGSPRQVCRLAPPRSASTSTTRRPMRASCQPIEAARSDLPIPPLPPPTDQIWRRVSRRRRLAGLRTRSGPFQNLCSPATEVSKLRAGFDFFQTATGA